MGGYLMFQHLGSGGGVGMQPSGVTPGATSQAQTFTNGIAVGDGLVGTPILTFVANLNTGFYRNATNSVAIAGGGAKILTAQLLSTSRVVTVGDGTNQAQFILDGAAGSTRDFIFMTGGSNRWIYRVDSTAEGGSNAGSDFNIIARDDAGANLGSYLFIRRSTGYIGVGGIIAPTAGMHMPASTTARASACIPHGAAPTSPVNGDVWSTTAGLFIRINGVTKTVTLT